MFGKGKKGDEDESKFQLTEELHLNEPKRVQESKCKLGQEVRVSVYVDPCHIRERNEGSRCVGMTTRVGQGNVTATFTTASRWYREISRWIVCAMSKGVRPAAWTSPTRSTEIMPSGRTRTCRMISGSGRM